MKVLIMAGGSGERFWPLSTKERPKQLLPLISENSLIKDTFNRINKFVDSSDIFVATNLLQAEKILQELDELDEKNLIIEPDFKDTAAAIIYGSTIIAREEENPSIVVLASDHIILDEEKFESIINTAVQTAELEQIVTLGVKPTKPETGYGYIRINSIEVGKPTKALRFMEKPNLERANEYLDSGKYVWNSGMFVFRYQTLINEVEKHLNDHFNVIQDIRLHMGNLHGLELSQKVSGDFSRFEKISIDFGIMEKSDNIACIPVDFGWNDVGNFNALEDIFDGDRYGNVIKDCKYIYVHSNNNIVLSDDPNKLITTIGISNAVIIATKNEVLICDKDETQRIKELLRKVNN